MISLSEDLPAKIESVLFSSGRKMNVEELSKLCRAPQDKVQEALQELKRHYDENEGSLMLMSEGDSWKLTVREKFLPLVQKIVTQTELPKGVIETLAVIAFKHPILQSDLVKIRTNKAYEHLAQLEEAGYIAREKHGRTRKIRLAQKFFDYFDLPPERVRDAFSGFEAVEKAIEAKEKELGRTLEVYEAKGATEEKVIDEKKNGPPMEEREFEIVADSSEEKSLQEKIPGSDLEAEVLQPESSISEDDSGLLPEDFADSAREDNEQEAREPAEAPARQNGAQRVDDTNATARKSGMVGFFKDEQNINPFEQKDSASIRVPREETESPNEELSTDPEKMIQQIIEKKADAIMHPPKEDEKKPGKPKDFLSEAYDEIEQDKKELEKRDR
ncbi:MAG: SMC-Scp complex subunit ScpB [Candidatus Woesearchaeota archaeon]